MLPSPVGPGRRGHPVQVRDGTGDAKTWPWEGGIHLQPDCFAQAHPPCRCLARTLLSISLVQPRSSEKTGPVSFVATAWACARCAEGRVASRRGQEAFRLEGIAFCRDCRAFREDPGRGAIECHRSVVAIVVKSSGVVGTRDDEDASKNIPDCGSRSRPGERSWRSWRSWRSP